MKLNLITEEYFPPTVARPIQACHAQLFSMRSDERGVNESPLSVSLLMSGHGGRCIYFSSVHVKCKTANRPFVSVGKRKFHGAINIEHLQGCHDAGQQSEGVQPYLKSLGAVTRAMSLIAPHTFILNYERMNHRLTPI